jgi:CyaY protein
VALSESEYLALAQPELARLLNAVDELGEEVDAELGSDILTIEFKDGARFVINSHRAARQIWMAADARAWHFDATPEGEWVAHKDGSELWATLSATLSRKLGRATTLKPG